MNQVLMEQIFPSGQRLQIVQGDLTEERVDAIVNAANANLQHGGGVAGVIVRKGGSEIQSESDAWVRAHGPVRHSEPAYTSAGRLPSRYIIHAVGPVWGAGEEDEKLAAAVKGSLALADRLNLRSIALPAISTGVFGFPKARAAQVIFRAIEGYYEAHPGSGVEITRLTLFDQPTAEVFRDAWSSQHNKQ